MRADGRLPNQLRPISFELNFIKWAEGSVLTKFGDTHVLCNVTIDNDLPRWLKNRQEPQGWLTAEYAMLPRSTQSRTSRERQWPKGRTQEISRLIGRSLRMALDLSQLGERTITVDCDVLQADGGTRTAAITGGWLAVRLALQSLIDSGDVSETVLTHQIAAISVGLLNGQAILDLPYVEDVAADVDMNVVMTGNGRIIELQGTGEHAPFDRNQFNALFDLAVTGITRLTALQNAALQSIP
jgi:ribonuclease PH